MALKEVTDAAGLWSTAFGGDPISLQVLWWSSVGCVGHREPSPNSVLETQG